MVEVPVVVQVLVVPADLARVGIQGERRVVVQVLLVRAVEHELGRGGSDRGADQHKVEILVVARRHPRADVPAFFERHVAPALVAGFAGSRDRASPPDFRTGLGVVRGDDAGVGPTARRATAPRDGLAVGDDRSGTLDGWVRAVVEDLRLPHHLAGRRIEGEDVVVDARVDDELVVDRDVAVVAGEQPADEARRVFGDGADVLPDEVAAGAVECLDDVVRVRHVEPACIGERCRRLAAVAQRPRPHHAQGCHVPGGDLVERAIAQAVRGAPPTEPVPGCRVGEHGVGDRRERILVGSAAGGGEHGGRSYGRERSAPTPVNHSSIPPRSAY